MFDLMIEPQISSQIWILETFFLNRVRSNDSSWSISRIPFAVSLPQPSLTFTRETARDFVNNLDNLFPSPPILPLSRLLSWWIRCFGAWFDIPLWVPLGFDTLCTLCSDISIDCWYYALQTFGSIPDQNMRCSQCSQITYPKISVFYSDYHDQAMVLDSAHLNVSLYIVHLNHFQQWK